MASHTTLVDSWRQFWLIGGRAEVSNDGRTLTLKMPPGFDFAWQSLPCQPAIPKIERATS
jgi:hypothetical protein